VLAADVACCVQPGEGDGIHRNDHDGVSREPPAKVSAREFAEAGGTTHQRVIRYLDAWDAAAEAGLVPASATLAPASDPALPEGLARAPGQGTLPRQPHQPG
jgi:hypothetical protein